MHDIAESYGVTRIVPGGQTVNPSVESLLEAVSGVSADDVILLPNNKNVVLAAKQAAQLSQKRLHVVETHSMPQGIAALMAFAPDLPLHENLAAMRSLAAGVRTIEVTHAARPSALGTTKIAAGQPIALLDDELIATAQSSVDALVLALRRASPRDGAALTLYVGEGVPPGDAESAETRLMTEWPGSELQVLAGRQPLYDYLLAVE
jgi:dihydroxyacetone kinase-like predicted kinase